MFLFVTNMRVLFELIVLHFNSIYSMDIILKLWEQFIKEAKDPKVGTGKKPKGSGRRLYTDEDPTDTVSVKFRTAADIRKTLSKKSFKAK